LLSAGENAYTRLFTSRYTAKLYKIFSAKSSWIFKVSNKHVTKIRSHGLDRHNKHDKFQIKNKHKHHIAGKRPKVARAEQLSQRAKKNVMISSQMSTASSPSL
jgi:hypothetical protein